jgi:hypothetical protein
MSDYSPNGTVRLVSDGRAVIIFPADHVLDAALTWVHGAVAEWIDGPAEPGRPMLKLRKAEEGEEGLKLTWDASEEALCFHVPVPDGKRMMSREDEAPAGPLN